MVKAALDPLVRLSATEIATRVRDGSLTSLAVVEACLARIAEREDERHAFAYVDPDRARAEARERDRVGAKGPFAGVPFGVKDIIDTHDMPTGMGSPIYAGHRPLADAACVAILRAAGGVCIGKTVTTEFAASFPGPTTNPHDPARTPGGSSSGSAAGVADFMMPVAFGTQTFGSVLRPSSYCGVIGFKPTFDTFNLAGVKPGAEDLDTLGLHARSVDDIALMTAVLVNRPFRSVAVPDSPPSLGLCRTPMWSAAQPETVAAIDDAAARLSSAGARVREVLLPAAFGGVMDARDAINAYQRARVMAFEWAHRRALLSSRLAAVIETGLAMPYEEFVAAIAFAEFCRSEIPGFFEGFDAFLAPAADGEAPKGLSDTGNARFQGFWTFMRLPTITLPTHASPAGMPVGIQLVARHHDEQRLLSVAKWVYDYLGPSPVTPV